MRSIVYDYLYCFGRIRGTIELGKAVGWSADQSEKLRIMQVINAVVHKAYYVKGGMSAAIE